MQVNSSVVNRYYTPYQTNKNVKYCAGFTQTEDGKLTPNETTENPGFAEFVDYQEFHKAWMSQNNLDAVVDKQAEDCKTLADFFDTYTESCKREAEIAEFLAKFDAAEEISILTSESTMCTYPASNADEEDVRYITSYTKDGIFCRKVGQTEGYEWTIPFENEEQYENLVKRYSTEQ